jgi:tRNA A-37 threonylcarbamoyl transferase component Bud32
MASDSAERNRDDAIQAGRRTYPLAGYARRTFNGAEVVGGVSVLDAFAAVVEGHGTLYSWARHQAQPRALRGRAPVYIATLEDAERTTTVVRHSWHGGLFAPLTGDRFRRPTRAPLELLRSYMLRECGIPTPEVLAFALYAAGPMMARVDVATRYVSDAQDLAAVLTEVAPDIARADALVSVKALLVSLAECGFTHPDLNIKNILLYRNAGQLVAAVLDVDVVQWTSRQKPAVTMRANVARLMRSLQKARAQFGVKLPDAEMNDWIADVLASAPAVSRFKASTAPAFTGINYL